MSFANKLRLSIIANQINDNDFYFKNIVLRNAYDVFLLSKKTNAKDAVNSLNKLSHPLNCFLAACDEVFNKVETIKYDKNEKTALYLRDFNNHFINPITNKKHLTYYKIYDFIKKRLIFILKATIHKEYRVWLFNVLTDKDWYKRKINLVRNKKVKPPKNSGLFTY